jgi:hypothetical protein
METPTRWTQLPKHISDSTTQVGQDHVATGVLLVLGTNNHLDLLEKHNITSHSSTTGLHRLDRWAAPVRLVPAGATWQNLRTSIEGSYTGQADVAHRSDWSKPGNPKSTKQTKLKTAATWDNRDLTKTFTRGKSHKGPASIRPVTCTGQTGEPRKLGMNNTHGSTPPNPIPDLPIRSTDLHKTLGIVGTPPRHSIAKLWSTKTC